MVIDNFRYKWTYFDFQLDLLIWDLELEAVDEKSITSFDLGTLFGDHK